MLCLHFKVVVIVITVALVTFVLEEIRVECLMLRGRAVECQGCNVMVPHDLKRSVESG